MLDNPGVFQNLSTRPRCLTLTPTFSTLLSFQRRTADPLITSEYEARLYNYIGGIIRGVGGISLELNGTEDHVHVLTKLRPDRALADVLRDLKANATGWMHDIFPALKDFSWQRGYGAFTASHSNVEEVRRYIARQREHHAKVSFRDEFILFLKENGIEYDERIRLLKLLSPASQAFQYGRTGGPGVPLRSTPSFTLTPASRAKSCPLR